MKDRDFFHEQYDRIDWPNQDQTRVNAALNEFIINRIISEKAPPFRLFDVGSGIGFFIRMLKAGYGDSIYIEGCEPSHKSHAHFTSSDINKHHVKIWRDTFQNVPVDKEFDFITAIYVFPHFIEADLNQIAKKLAGMLAGQGKLIMVVSNEAYLRQKLAARKELLLEENTIAFNGRKYREWLHYVEIQGMGTVMDYDREEVYYQDLLEHHGLGLLEKRSLNSEGYICTVFTFQKQHRESGTP